MNKIIGREKEIEKLENALNSDKSELIVVYVRRRVGKNYLIRNKYAKNLFFEVSGIHRGNIKNQLVNFYNEITKKSKYFTKKKTPTDWLE